MDGRERSARMESDEMEAHKEVDEMNNKMPTNIKEEQISSDESRTKAGSKKRRHRASVACTSCRDRRIRVSPLRLRATPFADS